MSVWSLGFGFEFWVEGLKFQNNAKRGVIRFRVWSSPERLVQIVDRHSAGVVFPPDFTGKKTFNLKLSGNEVYFTILQY